jgi:hypothetical protein
MCRIDRLRSQPFADVLRECSIEEVKVHEFIKREESMRLINAVTLVFVLQLGTACTGAQDAAEVPKFVSTSPELERRDQPVAQEDVEILIRAEEILADESKWNREDDRICEDDESADRRSLFCALQRACIEVLGSYDHRRVALQEVRFAVEDVADGREFAHRLKDYNNLPETKFDNVKQVLKVAREKVSVRLANGEN